jgi:hypothetical protein
MPNVKNIYMPMMEELNKVGISFKDTVENIRTPMRPKL